MSIIIKWIKCCFYFKCKFPFANYPIGNCIIILLASDNSSFRKSRSYVSSKLYEYCRSCLEEGSWSAYISSIVLWITSTDFEGVVCLLSNRVESFSHCYFCGVEYFRVKHFCIIHFAQVVSCSRTYST